MGGGKGSKDDKRTPALIKMSTTAGDVKYPKPGSCKCWVATSFGRATCRHSDVVHACKEKLQVAFATIKVCKTHSDDGKEYEQIKCASRRQILGCHKKDGNNRKCTAEEEKIAATI